jgi:hypothetical protein
MHGASYRWPIMALNRAATYVHNLRRRLGFDGDDELDEAVPEEVAFNPLASNPYTSVTTSATHAEVSFENSTPNRKQIPHSYVSRSLDTDYHNRKPHPSPWGINKFYSGNGRRLIGYLETIFEVPEPIQLASGHTQAVQLLLGPTQTVPVPPGGSQKAELRLEVERGQAPEEQKEDQSPPLTSGHHDGHRPEAGSR